jgi:hypothetical protein
MLNSSGSRHFAVVADSLGGSLGYNFEKDDEKNLKSKLNLVFYSSGSMKTSGVFEKDSE